MYMEISVNIKMKMVKIDKKRMRHMGKDIKKMKIAVIGAGASGIGVALHFATNRFPVALCDIFDAAGIKIIKTL